MQKFKRMSHILRPFQASSGFAGSEGGEFVPGPRPLFRGAAPTRAVLAAHAEAERARRGATPRLKGEVEHDHRGCCLFEI